MDVLLDGFLEAVRLLVGGDPETWAITALTLRISLTATTLAAVVGVPLGTAVALTSFPGRRVVLAAANTGMGLPPVVVGLFVTVLLWRSGPLGTFGLLYTPGAMVVAQAAIATPVVVALVAVALQQVDPEFMVQMQGLGAGRVRALLALFGEARLPLLAAAMAAFGAVVSEVGAAQMVGGNLAGETPRAHHRRRARHEPRRLRARHRVRADPAGDRVLREPGAHTLAGQHARLQP